MNVAHDEELAAVMSQGFTQFGGMVYLAVEKRKRTRNLTLERAISVQLRIDAENARARAKEKESVRVLARSVAEPMRDVFSFNKPRRPWWRRLFRL